MGFDTELFQEVDLNDELICSICAGVLECPVTTECDHLFCSKCIQDWLRTRQTCPIDRHPLRHNKLRPAPRVIRNLIDRLKVFCLYRADGCQESGLTLDQLARHADQCPFNPDALVTCSMFCAKTMTRTEMKSHNCTKEVTEQLNHLQQQLQMRDHRIHSLQFFCFVVFMLLVASILGGFFVR